MALTGIIKVEPDRRQWRWYNFIFFWIADSLNIVSILHCVTYEAAELRANILGRIEHMDDFVLYDC